MLASSTILKGTGGEILHEGTNQFSGVSIDSRTIQEGELFIALRGERFDGHDFLAAALKRGAGALVEKGRAPIDRAIREGKTVIAVDDTLMALQSLAAYVRQQFRGPVVGVVGSNGKTTTKELIASILSTRARVAKTAGNFNNHIGMPLSVIRMAPEAEAMVLEMGANRPGEVDALCRIAKPDIGVVTNIGYEHLEGFGSLERVRDSELEILAHIKAVAANADDAFLYEGITSRWKGEMVTFGIESNADITAQNIFFTDEGTHFVLAIGDTRVEIAFKLSGLFNIHNALAAAAVTSKLGFSPQDIKRGIEAFEGVPMRFEIKKHRGIMFLNDVYNANPSSMEESIKELVRRVEGNKGSSHAYKRAIAVLGDMLELGEYAVSAHENIGARIADLPVTTFIGVGRLMASAVARAKRKGIWVETPEQAARELMRIMSEGDVVLIKGSRGIKMEKIFTIITEEGIHA